MSHLNKTILYSWSLISANLSVPEGLEKFYFMSLWLKKVLYSITFPSSVSQNIQALDSEILTQEYTVYTIL